MLSYCLRGRKNAESKNQCFFQNVLCVAVKNQDLLNSNKLVDC